MALANSIFRLSSPVCWAESWLSAVTFAANAAANRFLISPIARSETRKRASIVVKRVCKFSTSILEVDRSFRAFSNITFRSSTSPILALKSCRAVVSSACSSSVLTVRPSNASSAASTRASRVEETVLVASSSAKTRDNCASKSIIVAALLSELSNSAAKCSSRATRSVLRLPFSLFTASKDVSADTNSASISNICA